MNGKREYGDYQTPPEFCAKVCQYLKRHRNLTPTAIVEPTCGVGGFLQSSLIFDADEYYGIEINPEYCELCRKTITDKRVKIINSDFFSFSLKQLIQNPSEILIIGNPPWVTNSTLSSLNARNLPHKTNFKGLKGMDAITGASNFDICEAVILRLVDEYRDTRATISMLCKTSVARNIFQELKRRNIPFASCDMLKFDAFRVFGISADACILLISFSSGNSSPGNCRVYDFDSPTEVKSCFGYRDSRLYSDLSASHCGIDGQCCFTWRQGVKHDCARIMELTMRDGVLQNGERESVKIEEDILFPLVKSSMIKSPVIHNFSKYVLVTQKQIREDTEPLSRTVPKTWAYLNQHREQFEKRKSVVYRNAPSFSMFGVGDYTFSRYKVAVSGFYKKPLFSVLYSEDGKPVMTDDTAYFLSFDSYDSAYVAMLILNSQVVQSFLSGLVFADAKRPYTKKVLNRIDFHKTVRYLSFDTLRQTEQALQLPPLVTKPMYESFRAIVDNLDVLQTSFL